MTIAKKRRKLTPKQERFVEEYLVDLNATGAARRAGYSAKTASEIGFENLKRPEIQKAITEAQDDRAVRTALDQDYVITHLVEIVEAAEAKEAKATRSLELLGKHLGMFADRIKIEEPTYDLSHLSDKELRAWQALAAKARSTAVSDGD
jgi:phage terminase small subunit